MGATKLGLALLTLVAQTGAQEVGLAGPVGAGRSIQFHFAYDKGLMTHSGGVSDWDNIYTGGDPGCCEMCKKEFEKGGSNPSVWGRTDMYDYSWDHKYNFNSCTCYAATRDPEKLAQITVSNDGPVAGYCGSNATFADITFGDDMTFYFKSVENLGSAWDAKSVDDCCESCKNKSPEAELFEFHKYNKYCTCYKSIPGTRPETFAEGKYAGVCNNQ